MTIPQLKEVRHRYDVRKKRFVIDCAAEHGVAEALRRIKATKGYEKVSERLLRKWRKQLGAAKKKRGRPGTDATFNERVREQLIYASVEKVGDRQELSVKANVAYGYDIIVRAAQRAQKLPEFADNKAIQSLKFGKSWIQIWLRNMVLRRRRVSTVQKPLPPPEDVQRQLEDIQECLIDFLPKNTISADETGINYGINPKNQFVPLDASRATAPDSDEKARITSMLFGAIEGGMGPQFLIIKCTATSHDLSNTRVLQNLMQVAGFTASDGWTLKYWTRELTLNDKKKRPVTKTYKVPYMVHTDATVITVQHKAWMDSVRLCMWVDLVLGPYYKGEGAALIWDNCGPHGVAAVLDVMEEWNIFQFPLPKNMTDKLQVMDLVVNGPLKAAIRRARSSDLFEFFQAWKIQRLQADAAVARGEQVEVPEWNPPKPTLAAGILTLLRTAATTFKTPEFEASLGRCFVDCCLAPVESNEDGATFKCYEDHSHGSLNKSLYSNLKWQRAPTNEVGSLGELATQDMVMVTRADVEDTIDLGADASTTDEDSSDDDGDDDDATHDM